jgi:hypothetical protein
MQAKLESKFVIGILLVASSLLLAACSVKEDKTGGKEDVKIATPVGGLHVTTDANVKDVGLGLYPGATLKPGTERNKSSANVNISTPFFGLRVVALTYQSDDTPEKITDYYKKELGKYGVVVECRSKWKSDNVVYNGGNSSKPVTCGNEERSGDTLELKVGTEDHQRVVAIKPSGKGTEFSLVYVNARGGKEEAL